jgi:acetylornithine deacetylase/succinyl-diaminopimelate desuccinylase-like protein
MRGMPDLHSEAVDVLQRLIRFRTVNPPGAEREAIEWLADYLTDAGLECEIAALDPERPNLVARLRGDGDGPVLGYLGHVDTVLADPDDWSRDPWSGDVEDGVLWGRGAIDMKQQVATEAVAAAQLARSGWRPPAGELKVIAVSDEEAGSRVGARWLCDERPDLARVDYLLNEGGGWVMPLGDRRLYGVCAAEKGTFRFRVVARGRAGHASVPAVADNALVKLGPVLERLAASQQPYQAGEETRSLLAALGHDPDDPAAAVRAIAAEEPRLAALLDPAMRMTLAPTRISASEKINVIPAHAALEVDCRLPPGVTPAEALERVRALVGDDAEVEPLDEVTSNRSPVESPLMDAIDRWVTERDDRATVVPIVMPAFTDSRWWRDVFPECVAYGFCPTRHGTLYDLWPRMHGVDERIDVRDVHFAVDFFHSLPQTLLK